MTAKETLEKYGLKTDVKSIRERLRNRTHSEIATKYVFDWLGHPLDKQDEKSKNLQITVAQVELYRADLALICEIAERAEEVEILLDLYRLLLEFKERYNTLVRVLDRQECLENIREISEEIYLKEKELEELK